MYRAGINTVVSCVFKTAFVNIYERVFDYWYM